MPGQRNIKENFEEIYLRFDDGKRYLKNAKLSEIKSKDVQRCIKTLTRRHFRINSCIFLRFGYDIGDLSSIITYFCAVFLGMPNNYVSDRDKYTIMMRYVDQRIVEFVKLVLRKLQSKELITLYHKSFDDEDLNYFENTIDSPEDIISDEELISLDDKIALISDEIYILQSKSNLTRQRKKEIRKKKDNLKELKNQNSSIKKHRRNLKKRNRNLTKDLKLRLEQEWSEKQESLVYYTSSKYVSEDVRRAARRYCKKYGIDYKSLILQLIESRGYSIEEFNL